LPDTCPCVLTALGTAATGGQVLGKLQGRKPRREPQAVENAAPYGDCTDRFVAGGGGEAGTPGEKSQA